MTAPGVNRFQLPAHLILSAAALLTVFPLIIIWLTAFKDNPEVFRNPLALPETWLWRNLVTAWTQGRIGRYFINSLLTAVPVVFIVLICSSLAGYGFTFLRLPGTRPLLFGILIGMVIPIQALIVPLFFTLADYGLIDSIPGLILVQASLGLPFGIFFMRAFFRDLPGALIDAARIDGAGEPRILMRIVLPNARPALLTLAALQFMWAWNEFLLALVILHSPDLRTVTLGLFYLRGGQYTLNYSLISAGVLLVSLPIIIVFFALQRRFIEGLTAGAVKG